MKTKNKGLRIFGGIAFGLPVILGVFLGIAYFRWQDVNIFPMTWMFLPASGAMLAAFADRKEGTEDGENPGLPKVFYITFLIASAIFVLMSAIGVFLPDTNWFLIMNYLVMGLSVVAIAELLFMKKEKREAFGLTFTKNWKKSLGGIVLFIVLYLLLCCFSGVIGLLMGENAEELTINPYIGDYLLIVLPLNLVLTFIMFFGEEYGWRYYLQPVLQQKFGKKKGVIFLGVLWGIWHLPLNLFYYSPQTGFQSILVQIAGCVGMGVFFGWVYMRTQNIWAVTVIHFLNNNLGVALFNVAPVNVERHWPDTVITIALYLIVYLPFLCTKEYKEKKEA